MSAADKQNITKCLPVRIRILIPILIAFFVLAVALCISLYFFSENRIKETVNAKAQNTLNQFKMEIDHHKSVMESWLQILAIDTQLASAFINNDREALFKLAAPFLKQLEEQTDHTNFYFLKPDRVCFLGAYPPALQQDAQNGFTATESGDKKQIFQTMGIGPSGTPTLRAIVPWRADGKLIGYLEMGQDLTTLLDHVYTTSGVEFFMTLHKKEIPAISVQEGQGVQGQKTGQGMLRDSVIIYRTLKQMPGEIDQLSGYRLEKKYGYDTARLTFSTTGKEYLGTFLAIESENGLKIGDLIVLFDEDSLKKEIRLQMLMAFILCFAVSGLLLLQFSSYLDDIDSSLSQYASNLAKTFEQEKESNRIYRTILDTMESPVYICSPDFRIKYMNPAMIRKIGADKTGELCHKALYRKNKKCEWCVSDKVGQKETVEYLMPDPVTKQNHLILNFPVLNKDDSVSKLTIFNDVSQTKQKIELTTVLELAGAVCHEFNQPLQVICGYCELLKDDSNSDEQNRQALDNILKAASQMGKLTHQLMNITDCKTKPYLKSRILDIEASAKKK